MVQDKERYESAASKCRVDFIIKLVIFAAFIIASIFVIAFSYDKPVTVIIAAVAIAWFGFSLYRVIKESHPVSLFSPEYTGKVVKVYAERDPKSLTAPISEIYVAKEGGEIEVCRSLPYDTAKIYKIGDGVFHVKGTLCPIITDRECSAFPCPICAKLRTRQGKKCDKCGS